LKGCDSMRGYYGLLMEVADKGDRYRLPAAEVGDGGLRGKGITELWRVLWEYAKGRGKRGDGMVSGEWVGSRESGYRGYRNMRREEGV
jgi:hypothetical protein